MLPLAIVVFASAVWGQEKVDLASFVETPVETADDIPPPAKTPSRKKPAAEAPLPDDEAFSASADETALPEETPEGESQPPAAKGAPAAKSAKMKSAGTKSADAKAGDAKSADAKPAARERLVVGDAYTLEVKRGGVTQSFGGNLLKANEQWIVLRRVATGRNDYGVPLLSALPKVGNYFRRSYESLVEDDLWIPREAATIASHRHVDTAAAARNIPANEPPPKAHCGVAFVHEDKFLRRNVQLSAINAETLTVLMTTPFRSQYQQQIARNEILCISIPVILSNVRMTHRDDSQARQ
jgi:hypothetical protein